ncbi:MAG: hypothetical protein B7X95_07970 [Methylophilaceae bacterium 17-44-8]|nr:MAG: hypothetical protein B7Y32_01595 [Methylophilales bacterium 16-45-7]OZA05031.1 MAG: hypothetical protein B7X95_07970 [Methylophilaceae bacterium 17-44-8]
MKSINHIGIVTMVLLLTAGVSQAGDDSDHNIINQNLSKRPYQQVPVESTANKADHWEGATLVKEVPEDKKASPTQYQKFRINMLGQRPYMNGNQ